MKTKHFLLPVVLLFSSFLFAQVGRSIHFKTGLVTPGKNIKQDIVDSLNTTSLRFHNRSFVVLQFESIPSADTRKFLSANHIDLLEYIPDNAYTASISGRVSPDVLSKAGASALLQLSPRQKMEQRLANGILPASAVKVMGTIDVWISFPKIFPLAEVMSYLKEANIDVLSSAFGTYRVLSLRIASNRLNELASFPFVEYVQPAPAGDQLLNFRSRAVSGASSLNASVANGGKGLNGEGVVVGVGDNADVQTHIDFAGRLINRSPYPTSAAHGHHTTGSIAGAGNGNEIFRGYAPKATIVSQGFGAIIWNAPTYIHDYGMVITNNSYGDNIECDYYGTYDLYSRILDQMAFDYPNLQNVFSSGNSGLNTCAPFLPNYHTVLGGYQSAKNVITVGATTDSGAISDFSSRGPVRDGRTKPEIVSMGELVASAWAGNIYSYNNGTSMAAPAVVGGLALLYQRYRQLNGGANPKNGLMKALMCNGATDRGNIGPDFQYGFGWMNLLRSIDMMENSRYFNASVTNGATANHTITIPANTAQVKVMLYWNDPAASALSAATLVNDLDLELVDPSSATTLPKIPDTASAAVGNPDINAADHINNMEQVVINQPVAGTYNIRVKGTSIAQNPSQEYFVVYDIIPVQLKMIAPAGGENLVPSTNVLDMVRIRWEAYGFTSGTATLEYSTDNGATWSVIEAGVNINRTIYSWWVPNVVTSQALVRITKDGTGETSTGNPFVISGKPTVTLSSTQCEGYINIDWTPVAGATDYEVMMLQGDEMKAVATTTGTSYAYSGLSKDSTYYVTVRARINGKAGRRAVAIARQPNSGTCAGSISDNDLKVDAILSPLTGRQFTSTQLTAASPVTVRIKNLDDAAVNNFTIKYSINGGAYITESNTAPVAAGGTYTHVFTTTADLSATGTYHLVVVVKNNTTDNVTTNDTAVTDVKHLDNAALNLSLYFVDDMESASSDLYERDTIGLAGLGRYDFSHSTPYGRLRTFVNTGIAYSGSKALTLDVNQYYIPGNTDYLYGTFNLSNYNAAVNDIRLDFQFNNHGQQPDAANRVWIRGNDASPWIEVYSLDDNQAVPGTYKRSSSIELSDVLVAASQSFGTSFQVRWGQHGQFAATDKETANGYSFDDVRLYQVVNDLQMQSIDAPAAASCGLTNATQVKVSVRNSDNATITNIPVRYRVDNGSWISEVIPSIGGNATFQYTFATAANFSSFGNHTLVTVVDYGTDSFRENDTLVSTIINTPVISSFPYLQNFEASNGFWYTNGTQNSWEYGTPISSKISHAASGAKAWKTRLAGHYNDNELSYLYSPCFDVTGMSNPTLSFSVALDLEDCGGQLCDGAWVEYSADGIIWTKLGANGSGTNWYNKASGQLWSIQDYTRWHVATVSLPTGFSRLRLRFVLQSDPASNREGIAVDDIHVYDLTNVIYDGATMASPVTQNVSGNNWIDFTSGGKLVASIQPNNQAMSNTDVQAFINAGTVRHTATQYYHDRNITIKPATIALADSATVRFYFLDKESDSLIAANGCSTCSKPSEAYQLGVSKYSDPDDNFENGTISDDNQGTWLFIPSINVVKVPFDKGYYAEFKVRNFSEFWLSDGGFSRSTPLPVKLIDLTAQKSLNDDVLLIWKVGSEDNVARYEVELAKGNAALQTGDFVKIGTVESLGNTNSLRSYTFTDQESEKFGPRYYRLKIVNNDGSFTYSPVRSVVFNSAVLWQVYPNPSTGAFNLVYQLNSNDILKARVFDAKGSLVKEYTRAANGFVQKLGIDISSSAAGVYLLQVDADGKVQNFKLNKQ